MGENTAIEWADHTFNAWIGCTKVSPGCANCYAEARSARWGDVEWGPGKERRRTSAANWRKPLSWDRAAARDGVRPRVFCASLSDWLDPEVPAEWLADLLGLIADTLHLDWLLLTKRPELWRERLEDVVRATRVLEAAGAPCPTPLAGAWLDGGVPANVWVGTTVEDQRRADERIPQLVEIPARVRFLSCEPLLGAVGLTRYLRPLAPVPLEETPETWEAWNERDLWPEWVPEKWRRKIESFHCESWGRGPKGWIRDHAEQNVAPFGAIMCDPKPLGAKADDPPVVGRFVHTWNNMGILVQEDGTARVTSTPRAHLFDPGPASSSYQAAQWVICGGESGASARPMHPEWARSLRDQCVEAGVAFHFKQWGAWEPFGQGPKLNGPPPVASDVEWLYEDGRRIKAGVCAELPVGALPCGVRRVGKGKAGRELDGRTWDEVPR